jgi:Spy/CpxP family protein refolding chaperone
MSSGNFQTKRQLPASKGVRLTELAVLLKLKSPKSSTGSLQQEFCSRSIKVMALRKTLTFIVLALGLTLAFAASAFAQRPQQDGVAQPQQQREREGRRRRGGPGFGLRGLRELNLSDAQREQARAIFERFAVSMRPQREQLMQLREQRRDGNATADVEARAKELRAQIHESEKAMRAELMSILTQEQRTKLEAVQKERKERRDERRQRRGGYQPEI